MKMTGKLSFLIGCVLVSCLVVAGCAGPNRISAENPATVAVWPFDDLSPGHTFAVDSMLMPVLTDMALLTIQEMPRFRIVERHRLEAILREQHLGSSELADQATRLRLGRLLGARWMLFGTYQKIGAVARLDLRVVDVETSKVLAADSRMVEVPDEAGLVEETRDLVEKVLNRAAM